MTITTPLGRPRGRLIIGLTGRKRVGKDTLARELVDEYGFTALAFADPLREAALALDPIVGRPAYAGNLSPSHDVRLSEVIDAIGWEAAKDLVPEVRRTLQRLGTEAIRSIDDSFWTRAMSRRVARTSGPIVVTDVRFPNEAATVEAFGGFVIRVERPDLPASGDPHPSETLMDTYPVDGVVLNTTLDSLKDAARILASS